MTPKQQQNKAALQELIERSNKLRAARLTYKKRQKAAYDKERYETRRPAAENAVRAILPLDNHGGMGEGAAVR